ncbi:similar to An18g00680 [Aspergillus luchuensis]|uniref:Similar to An18g00680 n=1 Tax=Aspergillus kawachii TaxID=1069201 RepID=A0A146F552_ASPKA|nr:similar to An18g00680 [Aspergillus luchuensis]
MSESEGATGMDAERTTRLTGNGFLMPEWGQDETAIRAGGDHPVGDALQSGMAALFIGRAGANLGRPHGFSQQ